MTEFIVFYLHSSKNAEFGVGCAEVIPKAYISTPSGELQCKTSEGLDPAPKSSFFTLFPLDRCGRLG